MKRRPTEVLAICERGSSLTLAHVRAGEGVVAQREAPRTGNLDADLAGALSAARTAGAKLPRHAVLLSDQVTALCLEVPPLSTVPQERIEGLVRFELEPLLPEAGTAGLACGWAEGNRRTDAGPLLTCGLLAAERDSLVSAAQGAGLTLLGAYAPLSCAAALAPAGFAGAVVELGEDVATVARVEHGRVERLNVARAEGGASAAEAALALIEPEQSLLVTGEVSEEDLELLRAVAEDAQHLSTEGVPASLVGAARHALGLPGGERVAGVPARPSAGPRASVPWRALAAVGLLLVAVGATDVWLQRRVRSARARLTQAEALAHTERTRQKLVGERVRLQKALGPLRASVARSRDRQARAQQLDHLLGAMAEAPVGIALDTCTDDGQRVTLKGEATSPDVAEAFLQSVARALGPRGLQLADRHVRRGKTRHGERGFLFEATLVLGPALKGAVK